MEEYGKIRLYNARNDMLDMTNPDMFGADQEGLGVQFESEFRTADSHFLVEKSELQRKTLSLNLWLGDRTGQSYQRFSDLVAFLNHTPYRIEYETPTGIWSRDCILNELTKSLIKEESILVEELQLDFTTPFYIERSERTTNNPPIEGKSGKIYETVTRKRQVFESVPESYREGDLWNLIEGDLNEVEQSGYFIATKSSNEFNFNDFVYYGQSANENTYYDKIYDYTYSFDDYPVETEESYYTYDYVYADEDEGKNVFQVDNHSVYIGSSKHSPCEITIYGPCENPHWQVTQGSKILQSDGFNLTVPEGHRLVVSSNPQSQRAVLIALDGTLSNVYQQQDLGKSNFVTFPVGRSKILFFNCDKVSFSYREERVTV